MVATTFAADTPLAVTELIAESGISGNWVWWYGSIGSIITVYFFAPLWKRSGVSTDLELVALRYSGKGSIMLRIFKSVYLGFFMNILIMAWVNLAMLKIAEVLLPGISPALIVSLLFLFAFFYTSLMGLSGISYADAFQFFFAMAGCILLAFLSLSYPEIGGMENLKAKLPKAFLEFTPNFDSNGKGMDFSFFLVLITVTWWASWYPGQEPGGGGYIAQRILASKDMRSSSLSVLWFTIAHYFIRPWPWIIVALVAYILFPELSTKDKGKGYILSLTYKPIPGLTGFFIATFMAAYLSTIATHLNWGTSYLINDLYKPYISKKKTDSHYIRTAYLIQLIMMLVSLIITFYFIDTISGVWKFLLAGSAGLGFVLIARWFSARLNSYSELSAFLFPLLYYFISHSIFEWKDNSARGMLFTVSCSIFSILVVTYLTPKTDFTTLKSFYKKVRPPGIFWKRWAIQNAIPLEIPCYNPYRSFLLSVSGIGMVFGGLFGIGYVIFQEYSKALIYLGLLFASGLFTYIFFPKYKE